MSETIVLASGNPHKREELAVALAPLDIDVTVLSDPPDVEETGDTFAANALLKALGWYDACGQPSLADDSGLEVDALDGEPGVYSARYAGIDGSEADAANNLKLLQELGAETERSARFRCALALVAPKESGIGRLLSRPLPDDVVRLDTGHEDLVAVCCTGTAEGSILNGPRGNGGFGYDPLFLSEDLGKTFAEAPAEEKAEVSHRAKAVSRLKAVLSP